MRDAESDGGVEEGQGGFLARWSERKQAARRGAALADAPPGEGQTPELPPEPIGELNGGPRAEQALAPGTPSPGAASLAETPSDEIPAPVLTDADMPPLETLDGHSDYSGFMSTGVSPELRRRALAQLFRSPHLNVSDGLLDYAEDFTVHQPLGDLVTADMRHQLARAVRELAEGPGDGGQSPESPAAMDDADDPPPLVLATGEDDDGSAGSHAAEPQATDASSRGSA